MDLIERLHAALKPFARVGVFEVVNVKDRLDAYWGQCNEVAANGIVFDDLRRARAALKENTNG